VLKPEDLKKQKLFVYAGDPDGVKAWRDAGFHTVPLEPSDLMSSLQSGMVEAFTTTPLSAAAYQWFGLTKNMCGMQWAPMIGGIVVSNRVWNRVPDELRPKLAQAAEEIGKQMQEKIDTADEQATAVMMEHGLEITEVSEEDIALWEAEVRKGFDKLIGKSFDKESFELVNKYLQEFRAQ
jgi:TRAP-type C4-dicarboxylate transport system substrate-binding protein